MKRKKNRREFLGATAAALWAGGASVKGAPSRKPGPNDTVHIGLIGCGGRGRRVMGFHQKVEGVRVAAVCDLNQERLNLGVEATGNPGVATYRDYRKRLENPDVDAVIVATNDQWLTEEFPGTLKSPQVIKKVKGEGVVTKTYRAPWKLEV